MQYVTNSSGEQVSVILPIAEYEALLSRSSEDETAYLLREHKWKCAAKLHREYPSSRNVVERELLTDEDN